MTLQRIVQLSRAGLALGVLSASAALFATLAAADEQRAIAHFTQVHAQGDSVLPCGIDSTAVYPSVDSTPATKYWRPRDLARDLSFAACTGWSTPGFSTLVTTAARFRFDGTGDTLLRRIGAVGDLVGVRYWSTTHHEWQQLIVQATALAGPRDHSHRSDFLPAEIRPGGDVFFQQTDNTAGKAIYRLRVTEASASRVVFTVENVATVRKMLITLFHAREMQSIHFFEHESQGVWRYYGIVRTGANASGLVTGHPSSSINRAVAFYRHYAGIPTDREPPAAR